VRGEAVVIESLYAVIVNWNLKEDTLTCIDSLFAAGAIAGQVIVVDNGSSDGSVSALKEHFGPSVHIIQNQQNLGFAVASNLGIQHALDQGAQWILLLNNDTYVAPTFLTELASAVQSDARLSVLGPVILYHDFPDRIWYFGDRLLPGLLATHSLYRGHIYQERFPFLVPVDFVNGCGMLVKREVFQRVGFFDRAYFMYGEEVDWCWRARQAGFRPAVATRARMWHKVSMSANRDQGMARYLRIRNQIRFYRSYARGVQLFLMFVFTGLRALWLIGDDVGHGRWALLRPFIRGWLDGWLNREAVIRMG